MFDYDTKRSEIFGTFYSNIRVRDLGSFFNTDFEPETNRYDTSVVHSFLWF